MFLSQQPGVPSGLVGVQSESAVEPGQATAIDFRAAVPLQPSAPPTVQPLGHTAEPSVLGERSHVGLFFPSVAGIWSAEAYGDQTKSGELVAD